MSGKWVLMADDDGDPLFWGNEEGWGADPNEATHFTEAETRTLNPALWNNRAGVWVTLELAHRAARP